ncbi:uncharacterized protein LOC132549674 [Ylistrum balloti]|uniref:uncharacterized protein LOC132549674 n=1 Tax=Ylistrum balloti TaxID=509963 RepID=UPI002905A6A9|nr:uncharacterized protein LOC132549674 [Ylistrum balloti]
MDSLLTAASTTCSSTERISNALATLRSEMLDLRQQDGQLMKQLLCINENIKSLSKRKPVQRGSLKKKINLLKGRRRFINRNDSIPEEDISLMKQREDQDVMTICSLNTTLSGSLSSIEDVSSCKEDLSSADSDSDDSICGREPNI